MINDCCNTNNSGTTPTEGSDIYLTKEEFCKCRNRMYLIIILIIIYAVVK